MVNTESLLKQKFNRSELCTEFNIILKRKNLSKYEIVDEGTQIVLYKEKKCIFALLDFGAYDAKKTIKWFEGVINKI